MCCEQEEVHVACSVRYSRKPWRSSFKQVHLCFFLCSCCNYLTPWAVRQATIGYQYPLYQSAVAVMLLCGAKGSFLFGNQACGHLTKKLFNSGQLVILLSDVEKSWTPYVNLVPMFSLPRGRANLGNKVVIRFNEKNSSFESEKIKERKVMGT